MIFLTMSVSAVFHPQTPCRMPLLSHFVDLLESLPHTPTHLHVAEDLDERSSGRFVIGLVQLDQHLPELQAGRRTLDSVTRVLLREAQVQPLVVVVEDLHWNDSESQALLDGLVESLPGARLLLLVNYRPEYEHGWANKSYCTLLRLDQLS